MRRDTFSGFHPAINFLYFVLVIGFAMTLQHPVCQAISLLSGFAWSCVLSRGTGGKRAGWIAGMFALTALVNPMFSHAGATILCYLPSGNPLTLESILYGLCAAATLACALVWFSCMNAVMRSDKILYLFGRVIPALSLLLSMTLRFAPRYAGQVKKVAQAQRALGQDVSTGGVLDRIRRAAAILSGVVTWALENAIDTADSMKSRGYGLPGRTAFSIYRFDARDGRMLAWLIFAGAYVLVGALSGAISWRYYPTLRGAPVTAYFVSVMLIYLALGLTPVILQCKEALVWTRLQSKT